MTAPPDVSVVVPVRNGAASLPDLLGSLAAQDLDQDRFEVIVIDNASSDGSADLASRLGAQVGSEPLPNRSRARNAGVQLARADLLAFIDADCKASSGWLSSLLECRRTAALIAGPVEIETAEVPNAIERFESSWRFDQARSVEEGWAATANLMVERSIFEALGGFDSTYRHIGEDVDFCLRARRAGYTLGFCAAAVVYHGAEREVAPVVRRAFFHGYSSAQVMNRLGVGHVAWRHLRPLVSPRAALAWHGVSTESLTTAETLRQSAVAIVTYACRVAGSVWASLRRAR